MLVVSRILSHKVLIDCAAVSFAVQLCPRLHAQVPLAALLLFSCTLESVSYLTPPPKVQDQLWIRLVRFECHKLPPKIFAFLADPWILRPF